jgi:hypothetical protein
LTLSLNHQDRAQAYHKRNNPRAMDGQHFLLGDRGHTTAAGQQHQPCCLVSRCCRRLGCFFLFPSCWTTY